MLMIRILKGGEIDDRPADSSRTAERRLVNDGNPGAAATGETPVAPVSGALGERRKRKAER